MIVAVFAFGAIIGSFLNVCIVRLPEQRSIVRPPSHCPTCRRDIAWYDNVPLLSYLLLRGPLPRVRHAHLPALPPRSSS